MGSLGIPLFIACNTSPHSTVLCTVAVIVYRFISVSTALHILAATIERYIFVVYPLRYQVYVTTGRVLVVIGFVWGISSTVALLQIMWVQFRFGDEANKATLLAEYVYNISGIVLFISLPVVVMLYTDVRMLLIIHRQRLQILKQRVFSLRGARDFKQDVKSWSTHLRSVKCYIILNACSVRRLLDYLVLVPILRVPWHHHLSAGFSVGRVWLPSVLHCAHQPHTVHNNQDRLQECFV